MRKTNFAFLAVVAVLLFGGTVLTLNTLTTVDTANYTPAVYASAWALIPPVLAIALALVIKEVYTSLFAGIVVGALLYANGNFVLTLNTLLFADASGLVSKLSDSWNAGILIFLVVLGIFVTLMNKTGASRAFGDWASQNITTRVGAQVATSILGMLIFVDDYFNCLTVGSVMRPVTDRYGVSRAKLAYLIDSTAAPICIIAPVSSWAAAVTSSVPEDFPVNGFSMFLSTIPYNFYAICTIFMMLFIAVKQVDFGPMTRFEENAKRGDIFTTAARPYGEDADDLRETKGGVIDLVFPVIVLILSCMTGMIYTGGYFDGTSFIDAFSGCDASKSLVIGSMMTLIVSFVFYISRGVITFSEFTECIPDGFKAMVAPIMILCLAWTLSGMTNLLGGKIFIRELVANSASGLAMFLPAIVFVVAALLAFATGTSWGTFAILIPIVCAVYDPQTSHQMLVISISACLSGAVCGDHCSPISDTTIMASAGARCDHVDHVSTQLPYAITVAAVSALGYVIAGVVCHLADGSAPLISLPITLVCLAVFISMKKRRA